MPDLLILAGIGLVSAWMGDRLGIPGALIFLEIFTNYIIILQKKKKVNAQSLNLSGYWPGQCLDGRPPRNTSCFKIFGNFSQII